MFLFGWAPIEFYLPLVELESGTSSEKSWHLQSGFKNRALE